MMQAMSSSAPPWTLERFVLDSGESPARAFLEGLGGRDRVDALALLKLLAEQGNALKMPHSKPLGGGYSSCAPGLCGSSMRSALAGGLSC
jgi:hypothetical protein